MRIDTFARMVDELQQLDERIEKLNGFLWELTSTNGFREAMHVIPAEEMDLKKQREHMGGYREALASRIARHAVAI